jgi:hypothetical protein
MIANKMCVCVKQHGRMILKKKKGILTFQTSDPDYYTGSAIHEKES